jgi:hypothetical protein
MADQIPAVRPSLRVDGILDFHVSGERNGNLYNEVCHLVAT